jgi:PAS domain-containing protein
MLLRRASQIGVVARTRHFWSAVITVVSFFSRNESHRRARSTDVARAIDQIAAGDLSGDLSDISDDSDWTRVLLPAIRNLQDRLRERQVTDLRLTTALDAVTVNVMIADADDTIVYMNPAVTAMMNNAESDIRKTCHTSVSIS